MLHRFLLQSPNFHKCIPALTVMSLASAGVLSSASGQSNPAAQTLPYSQDFGSIPFSSMPPGTAAWGGLSGASVNSEIDAASSAPTQNASVSNASAATTTGGAYGLADSGNARFYIQTSGNTSQGVSQLVLAVNTIGQSSVSLGYDLENIKAETRTVGALCQFRVGTSGSWTTLAASTGPNPYLQSGGTPGSTASVEITLPPAAVNQPNVQIRWALWRGDESGSSSGLAIDNITVVGSSTSNIITISLDPESLPETSGENSVVATVSTSEPVTENLSITLSSSDGSEAIVSSTNPAVITAGLSSVTFDLSILDDTEADGIQIVTIQASAANTVPASAILAVTDNEDPYSPPADFYLSAEGLTGTALKNALKLISSIDALQFSYSGTYTPMRAIHEDPANSSNLLTIYSGASISKFSSYFSGQDGNTTWSREHVWPVSFGLDPEGVDPGFTNGDAGPDYTDLFNLRPCFQTVNTQRGNSYFDESSGTPVIYPLAPECSKDNDSWEPRDEEKGDIARIIFYMATRYDGTDPKTIDLEIGNSPSSSIGRFARLGTLLRWHENDPVSSREREQNHLIYSAYQLNRNPFVDHPEYVALIWGTVLTNKSEVAVTEGGPDDSYSLVLTSAPEQNVTVTAFSNPADELSFAPPSVTFTPSNWDSAQTIAVSAINNDVYQPTRSATVSHQITTSDPYYSTITPVSLTATVTDDDPFTTPTVLPFTYDGPWPPPSDSGFVNEGTGSYTSDLGTDTNTGSSQFNGSGDRLTLSIFESPGTLGFRLKGNPSLGTATEGSFKVFESDDGITYSLLRTITNKSNADESLTEPLSASTRFISFLYETKITGNIQLDKLSITAAITPWQVWISGFGLTGPQAAGGFDFDNDGFANLAEYALGRSPAGHDDASTLPFLENTAVALSITAVLRGGDASLTSTAETTTDPANPASWTSAGITRTVSPDQTGVPPGFERVVFQVPSAGKPAAFIRLRFRIN